MATPVPKDTLRFVRRLSWIIVLLSVVSCVSCFHIWEYVIPLYRYGLPLHAIYDRYPNILAPILPLLGAMVLLGLGIVVDLMTRKKAHDPAKKYYLMAGGCIVMAMLIVVAMMDVIVR